MFRLLSDSQPVVFVGTAQPGSALAARAYPAILALREEGFVCQDAREAPTTAGACVRVWTRLESFCGKFRCPHPKANQAHTSRRQSASSTFHRCDQATQHTQAQWPRERLRLEWVSRLRPGLPCGRIGVMARVMCNGNGGASMARHVSPCKLVAG